MGIAFPEHPSTPEKNPETCAPMKGLFLLPSAPFPTCKYVPLTPGESQDPEVGGTFLLLRESGILR